MVAKRSPGKQEIGILDTKIEHPKKESIDVTCKVKITKLKIYIKNPTKQEEHNEDIKSINLQFKSQDGTYVRNNIKRIEIDLKEDKDKIKLEEFDKESQQ